ncbi:MAG: class I SAM-dependent methyltransferase [Ktedonobacteraceae bacterium]|nr:class I SAM-dependent methyltransferase [Ktedonobacteraceae bacterium]
MNHSDHVRLLRKGVPEPGGVWADLGSGSGAFTLALADLLGPTGQIYSVDKDRRVLQEQEQAIQRLFPAISVEFRAADFTRPLDLPSLDGIVMANSLHYVRDKETMLQRVRAYLKPGGRLLLVEYNVDHGNVWVPYPLSYPTWERLARQNNLSDTQLLERVPSRFLNEIYSALSFVR